MSEETKSDIPAAKNDSGRKKIIQLLFGVSEGKINIKDILFPFIAIILVLVLILVGNTFNIMMINEIEEKCGTNVIVDSVNFLTGAKWHFEDKSLLNRSYNIFGENASG